MAHKFVAQHPCPVCGQAKSYVISTKPVENGPYALIRYRRCASCDFKWYVGQGPEVLLESVKWNGRDRKNFQVLDVVPMKKEELVD
jgi:transcriptional regulator NrdR family protein